MTKTKVNGNGFDDLREFVEFLDRKGELVTIHREVNSKHEVARVQMKILNEMKKAVLFTNVDGKGRRLLGNIYTFRNMISYMFGVEAKDLVEKVLSFRGAKRIGEKVIDHGDCQTVVHQDFKEIKEVVPIPWNYEKDGSFYVTAGIAVVKDPETGKVNSAICRMMVRGGRELNIFFAPMQRNWTIFNKYRALKRDMPIAVIIGADPYVMFASEAGVQYEVSKYEYAGTMKGGPIEVVRCKTVDLHVPANAEYILEGAVSWEKTAMEGPMGENQRVYGPMGENPTVTLSCITHREDPIYQNILPGTVEEQSLLAVPMEARLLEVLRTISPQVITINLLPNFMNCVIQVDDFPAVQRGLGKNLLLAALSDPWIKYAVVVDKDVNIDDPDEVNWAISTRADLSENLLLVKNTWGFVMDPSRKTKMDPVTKLGIDATVDPFEKERFLKADVMDYQTIGLKDYV
ncbi:MAG: UbiD family decarboxylase [Deltaproteobacteria bacterium]